MFIIDSISNMIKANFLSPKQRIELLRHVRSQREDHGVARRANALLLLDDGKSCVEVGKVLYIDDDSIRNWHKQYMNKGWDFVRCDGWAGSQSKITIAQSNQLSDWIQAHFCNSSKGIRAYILEKFGISYSASGCTKLLKNLGFEYKKPKSLIQVSSAEKQAEFIAAAVNSSAGRKRINIQAAVCLENFDTPFVEPLRVNGQSSIQLLKKIEANNPDKALIHVIWDNAGYHKSREIKDWLKRPDCRIQLHLLPPYCPHLNPIERLWAVMHQHVTHNKYYPNVRQFADAILSFLRETIPKQWRSFRDQVTDNFRIISNSDLRVLE